MIKLREYLISLKNLEEEQDSFGQLIKYFADNKSTLPARFCEGESFLPSFMLLKKLKDRYTNLYKNDSDLVALFDSAIKCSKLFYVKTIELVIKKKSYSEDLYEEEFEKYVQPFGQQLINLLANIKYRIKIIRVKNSRIDNPKRHHLGYLFYNLSNTTRIFLAHLAYRITLITSSNQNLVRKSYYVTILATIISFWIFNYAFLNNISPISSAFLNVVSGIAVVLLAIISYPMGDFGKKDICGRNIVAYNYKVLLNNRKNSRLVNVFTLKHSKSVDDTASSVMQNK